MKKVPLTFSVYSYMNSEMHMLVDYVEAIRANESSTKLKKVGAVLLEKLANITLIALQALALIPMLFISGYENFLLFKKVFSKQGFGTACSAVASFSKIIFMGNVLPVFSLFASNAVYRKYKLDKALVQGCAVALAALPESLRNATEKFQISRAEAQKHMSTWRGELAACLEKEINDSTNKPKACINAFSQLSVEDYKKAFSEFISESKKSESNSEFISESKKIDELFAQDFPEGEIYARGSLLKKLSLEARSDDKKCMLTICLEAILEAKNEVIKRGIYKQEVDADTGEAGISELTGQAYYGILNLAIFVLLERSYTDIKDKKTKFKFPRNSSNEIASVEISSLFTKKEAQTLFNELCLAYLKFKADLNEGLYAKEDLILLKGALSMKISGFEVTPEHLYAITKNGFKDYTNMKRLVDAIGKFRDDRDAGFENCLFNETLIDGLNTYKMGFLLMCENS